MTTTKTANYEVRENGGHLELEEDPDVDCGYGKCKPNFLQRCNNPKTLLFVMCLFTLSQGFVVNGINNVNTQSVERRFRLPSSRSGLISSSYDFAAAVFGVIISFVGSGRYKARWLSAAAIIMGLGSFTMALPHFTTGLYEWGQSGSFKTCTSPENGIETCEDTSLRHYLGVLILGMMLHGVGGCILYTVGVGLLDDSVTANKSPLYLGILYGSAAFGPGLGYIVGGQMLNFYVDFDKVDTSTIDLKTDDPRWVGAWWAGFFITMTTCFLVAIPLSCFGSEMPTAKKIRETRITQMHNADKDKSHGHGTSKRLPLKMMPKVTWSLMKNLPFLFTIFAGASEGIITSGFATFVPKFIQNRFAVSSSAAALYTGIASVPGAAGGMFFGGFICNRMKLKVKGMFKFAIITCLLTIVFINLLWIRCIASVPGAAGGMFFGGFICNRMKLKVKGMFKFAIITCLLTIVFINLLWIRCEEPSFVGITSKYDGSADLGSVVHGCNGQCGCTTKYFDPVCTSDNIQYFSACHAGCTNASADGNTFSNCSCLSEFPGTNVTEVTSGLCTSGCGMMYLFLVMFFICIFLTFLPSTASDAATLRCIHEDHRTFSMGLKWLFIRLLGTVPGPVIFGAVTDIACVVWQTECGENTSCWIYDDSAVGRNYFLVAMSVKIISTIFFSLAYWTYKPPSETENELTFDKRDSAKRQMSFVNGSFRESEFEGSVLGASKNSNHNTLPDDKTTNL